MALFRGTTRKQTVTASVAVALLAWVLYSRLFAPATPQAAKTAAAKKATAESAGVIPFIDLGRLDRKDEPPRAGTRDIFLFGVAKRPDPGTDGSGEQAPLPPPVIVPTPTPEATPTPLPALELRFIGSAQNGRGEKVAVLLTEKGEILTGRGGDLVANRYRISRIGVESVDLEDALGGGSRRLPLKGAP